MKLPDALPALGPRTPFGGDLIATLKGLALTKAWFVPERGTSEAANGAVTMVEEDASGVVRVFDRLGSTARLYAPDTSGVRPAFDTGGRWAGYNPVRFQGSTPYRYRFDNFAPDLSGDWAAVLPFEFEFDSGTGLPLTAVQYLLGKQTTSTNRITVQKPANQRVLSFDVGAKSQQLWLPRGRNLLYCGIATVGSQRIARFGINKTWAKDLDVTGEAIGSAAALALGALNTNGAAALSGWLGAMFLIQADLRDAAALAGPYAGLLTHYRTNMSFRV